MPDTMSPYASLNFNELDQVPIEDLREVRKILQQGLTGPFYHIMMAVINAVLVSRINKIVAPAASIESVLECEHNKGVYFGLAHLPHMLSGKLAEIQSLIEAKEPPDVV